MLKPRIAVLVSGGGTNLQALIEAQQQGLLSSGQIVLVVSNKPDVYALERARQANIPCCSLDSARFDNLEDFETTLLSLLKAEKIDLIVLAGFLRILSKNFVNNYQDRIVNVHPSLIPAYCGHGFYGLKVHKAVLAAQETVTGATVHLVNEIPDGGKIIMQKEVKVNSNDTPESLQQRVMEQAEWKLLPQAVELLCSEMSQDIATLLNHNSYPGRGIILGQSACGKAVLAYFIMGRSVNSRNRTFYKKNNELCIKIVDQEKLSDSSLILYTPLRNYNQQTIISNGDQTDTIHEFLGRGQTFEKALAYRQFEPDAPNFTPRISGIIQLDPAALTYKLSILKAGDPTAQTCTRQFFNYEALPGIGHFIHTYQNDNNPLPSFTGEPLPIKIDVDLQTFTNNIWQNLNEDNRVALYVRWIDLEHKTYKDCIVNINDFTDNTSE